MFSRVQDKSMQRPRNEPKKSVKADQLKYTSFLYAVCLHKSIKEKVPYLNQIDYNLFLYLLELKIKVFLRKKIFTFENCYTGH